MKNSDLLMREVIRLRTQVPALDLLDRATLLANLVFVHQVIVASEGLLSAAIEASDGPLCEYFKRHIEEERGHAEWLAADLASAGVDVGTVPRSRGAVAMAGSQYYMVNHVSPACLLGYMLVLECLPMPLAQIEVLEAAHGTDLLRTARYHAVHDPDHGAELLTIIDQRYCLDVLHSAVETVRYINEFVQELHHGR